MISVNKSDTNTLTLTARLRSIRAIPTPVVIKLSGGHSDVEDYGVGKHYEIVCSGATITNSAYNETTVSFSIPAGSLSKIMTITIVNNSVLELDRNITISGTFDNRPAASTTLTIVDDNADATLTVADLPVSCPIGGCEGWGGATWNLDNTGVSDNKTNFNNILNHLRTQHVGSKAILSFDAGSYLVDTSDGNQVNIPSSTNQITMTGPVDGRLASGVTTIIRDTGYGNNEELFNQRLLYPYSSATDNHRLSIVNICVDGRNNENVSGPDYQAYGLENSGLFFLGGDVAAAGKTGVIFEAVKLMRATGGAISAGGNMNLDFYNVTGDNNFKGISTNVIGNSNITYRDIVSTGSRDPAAFWCELAEAGYGTSWDVNITVDNFSAPDGGFLHIANHASCSVASSIVINNLTLGEADILPDGDGAQLPDNAYGAFRDQKFNPSSGKIEINDSTIHCVNFPYTSYPGEFTVTNTKFYAYAVEATYEGGYTLADISALPSPALSATNPPIWDFTDCEFYSSAPHTGKTCVGLYTRNNLAVQTYQSNYIKFHNCIFDESLRGVLKNSAAGGVPVYFDTGCQFNVSNAGDTPAFDNYENTSYMTQLHIDDAVWNLGGTGASGKKIRFKHYLGGSSMLRYGWVWLDHEALTAAENDGCLIQNADFATQNFAPHDAVAITAISGANLSMTITAAGHTFQADDKVWFEGINSASAPTGNAQWQTALCKNTGNKYFVVSGVSGNDFTITTAVDSSGYTAYDATLDEAVVYLFPLRTITGPAGSDPTNAADTYYKTCGLAGDRFTNGTDNWYCDRNGINSVPTWVTY